jgi:hypothetical protein
VGGVHAVPRLMGMAFGGVIIVALTALAAMR